MKAGDLKVTVFQNAAGQGAGSLDCRNQADQEAIGRRFVDIPFELVTPDNLSSTPSKALNEYARPESPGSPVCGS